MPKDLSLTEILKRERESREIDPEELSVALGLHKHVIARWEDGKQRPRFLSAVRWADALGFDIQITRRPAP